MQKNKGFTLVELLLVIAIISILVSLSILIYRQHEITNRIEKAALETQNFLAAALNYKNDYGKWPDSHDAALDCTSTEPKKDEFITHYLPNQSAQTAFGHYYCWSDIGKRQYLFWAAIKIPKGDLAIGKRLAALLPNAVTTTKPKVAEPVECRDHDGVECFVRVEISQTAANAGSNNTIFAGAGDCVPTNKVIKGTKLGTECQYIGEVGKNPKPIDYLVTFNCPDNTDGNVIAAPNFLYVGDTGSGSIPYALLSLQATAKNCQRVNNATANMRCTIEINALRDNKESVAKGANGQVGASYTAFCTQKIEHQSKFFSY